MSILLIAYRQSATVGEALRAALAQTYEPLEILASDDASDDGTWDAMQAAAAGYTGPHRLHVLRNEHNLGIGAHLSALAQRARGELLVVAAGDDVSLPHRVERLVETWLAHDHRPDLLASALVDIDAEGRVHGELRPSDLATYQSLAQWVAHPPYVVGAAQAWTKRLFDRFGPLAPGIVAEDMVMVFRAIASGGAVTIAEPLVQYRRGGISRRKRNLYARDVVERLLKNNRHALVEIPQLLRDAECAGQLDAVKVELTQRLQREVFVRDVFAADSWAARWRAVWAAKGQPWTWRVRQLVYAGAPWLLGPWFALKRLTSRKR